MRSPLRLSVLDLSPIPSGSSATHALRSTIDLARHAEGLGYTRYWLAEHHNAGSLACSAPEVLIGQVAAATRTIRVGSGGVMLPNHSALRVAEAFRVLEALFPGRIDLGLGRAAGTDPRTARALRRSPDTSGDEFPSQLEELFAYLDDDASPRPPFSGTVRAIPVGAGSPEPWVLGSSDFGAGLAARLGLGFAFAHHINPADAVAVLRRYREEFRPSRYRREPESIVAVGAICGESDEAARELAKSGELHMMRFARGLRDLPFPSVEEARAYRYDEEEEALRQAHGARGFVGAPAHVRDALVELAASSRADEVMVLTHVHDHAERRASYARLAAAFALAP